MAKFKTKNMYKMIAVYLFVILWVTLVVSYIAWKTEFYGYAWFFLILAALNLFALTIILYESE